MVDKKLRFKYIDQNPINNCNISKKAGREVSSFVHQSIHKKNDITLPVYAFGRLCHVSAGS
jgi:hypothetical protein